MMGGEEVALTGFFNAPFLLHRTTDKNRPHIIVCTLNTCIGVHHHASIVRTIHNRPLVLPRKCVTYQSNTTPGRESNAVLILIALACVPAPKKIHITGRHCCVKDCHIVRHNRHILIHIVRHNRHVLIDKFFEGYRTKTSAEHVNQHMCFIEHSKFGAWEEISLCLQIRTVVCLHVRKGNFQLVDLYRRYITVGFVEHINLYLCNFVW